jgi:hypothetical protein
MSAILLIGGLLYFRLVRLEGGRSDTLAPVNAIRMGVRRRKLPVNDMMRRILCMAVLQLAMVDGPERAM